MIVVAIIGILAAIAIPQYQDYVARSQVSEAVQLLGGAKTAIEETVSQTGQFPEDDGSNHPDSGALITLGIKTSGSYVAGITATRGGTDAEAGYLEATMAGAGSVSSEIAGGTIIMVRTADGDWTCAPGTSGSISTQHLPASCRTAVNTGSL